MLRITQELEECVDCIYRLVKLIERRYKNGRTIAADQVAELREHAGNTAHFIQFADEHLLKPISADLETKAKELSNNAKMMKKKFNASAMKRMADGNVKLEMLNIDLNNHFQAVSNHAMHVIQASQGIHE